MVPTDHQTGGQHDSSSWPSFKWRARGGCAAGGADASRGEQGRGAVGVDTAWWRGHLERDYITMHIITC